MNADRRSNPDVGNLSLCGQYSWDTAPQAVLKPSVVLDLLRQQLDFFQPEFHRLDDPSCGITEVQLGPRFTFDDAVKEVAKEVKPRLDDPDEGNRPISVYLNITHRDLPGYLLAVSLILRYHVIGKCVCILLDPHQMGIPGTQYSLRSQMALLIRGCDQVSLEDIQRLYRTILAPIMKTVA